jgi:hypothetical protein
MLTLQVNGRVIRGPEDAWAAWMADRGRDDILGETDWKALGMEKPRPMTFAEKLGKVTRAEAQRRRRRARVDQDQEQYLHKRILDAKVSVRMSVLLCFACQLLGKYIVGGGGGNRDLVN